MKLRVLVVAITGLLSVGQALAQDDYAPERTEWGQPDLQGVWNFSSVIPLERPAFFGNKTELTPEEIAAFQAQTELGLEALNQQGVGGYNTFWTEMGNGDDNRTARLMYPENGKLPETVEGVPVQVGGLGPDEPGVRPVRMVVGGIAKDGPEDRGLSERCILGFNSGPPFEPNLYNNNVQLIQSRNTAVIMTEMIHDARIVPLDDRPPLNDEIRLWTGDSRGYWDGDTLVVETRNFNSLTQSFSVYGSAEDKLLIERFTRTGPYTMEYEYTVDDPSTFSDKIQVMTVMSKVDGQVYEYACHEGNYGMVNILRGERMAEERGTEEGR
ncbi:MAG TPA: hypothetical protein DCR45_00805 [Gammaproteobacteria bacterium]|uniref:Lipocalin-like domain-containing protein n=1 Tax=OM182 bacterium TaxID=2510334 RepID=A0A520S5U2_9GAMM|nr:hypothetical protein [Gammaproteobacteria bacterium]RZO77847.1 MAG: hypothetical protein EVA69_01490 [OM182 bacterium]HAO89448.1 hypothetical protein [Gammaproteobacteria bacterium]HAR89489.1 hypothetical protein [Gammaproteobacteria bacterium]HBP99730.1 hypothetical protein [Gammaproteobacteria bacterium]|tara:strand:- start:33 stop:1010 length:978 start_codon:yes stop_codon:yes gene_type:complete